MQVKADAAGQHQGVHAAAKFLEPLFGNLLLSTEHELKTAVCTVIRKCFFIKRSRGVLPEEKARCGKPLTLLRLFGGAENAPHPMRSAEPRLI